MGARSLTLGWSFVLWGLAACNGEDSKPGGGGDDSGTVPPPTGGPTDMDLDGVTEEDGDCDDLNAGVYPGAAEECDGIDNNCNSQTDEGIDRVFYTDADLDGYGNGDLSVQACTQPAGTVLNHGDCNDGDAAIHPGAAEVCDDADVDEDCDALSDLDDPSLTDSRTFYVDADGDGYGEQGTVGTVACDEPPSTATNAYDCDDSEAAVNPNMLEVCDGQALDDDCDGLVDDADAESLKLNYWPDDDADSFGDLHTPATHTCFDLIPQGYVLNGVDCDDGVSAVNPDATELCGPDHVDDDCDGDIDEADSDTTIYNWYVDDDGDGYGATGTTPVVTCQILGGYAPRAGDCNDAEPAYNAGTDELCNAGEDIDEDCDGKIDEADPETPAIDYFIDTDGDGYGDSSTVLSTCDTVTGRVTDGGDCDEADTDINPGMFDDCEDGVDNDCDGSIDNCSIGAVSMTTGDAIIDGDTFDIYCGGDLANLGDVNGDGVGDMAIGCYGDGTYTGKASVFYGPVSGAVTIADSDVDITGAGFFDQLGSAIGGERDVNDDGVIDMIVGGQSTDASYVFYGPVTADAAASSADAVLTATYSGDQLGWGVDLMGDWDGDGLGEIVAMAPQAERSAGFYATGVVYVWTGPVSGSAAASTADWILGGSSNYDNLQSGYERSAVGDVNADGLEDLAAAAPWKDVSSSSGTLYSAGQVYVSFGGSLSPGTYDIGASGDVTVSAEDSDQSFGYGIASRSDYNGDGYDDLVASAYQGSSTGDYSGLTYVFNGPLSSGDMVVSEFDTRWEGAREEFAGRVIESGGDFNFDGKSDVLIGTDNHTDPGCMYCGGGYLVMGGVEGDRSLEDDAFAVLEGIPFSNAGQGVAFIDDWDGDDWDEVAVSAQYAEVGGMYGAGTTAVWSGGTLYP